MHVGSRSAAIGLVLSCLVFKPPTKADCIITVWSDFPRRGDALRETTSKDRFRRALLLMKPAHTGHHPGAVPGFRPSPGNSEETTTRVLTEEISVLFRVPTWDPIHPGSPGSRALPGNTPTQGPTREGKPGFFLGGGGNPGRNPGHGLGKTRERGGFRVFPGWYCWGLPNSPALPPRPKSEDFDRQ